MQRRRSAQKVKLKAETVWHALNRLHMTQNGLARLVGISPGYLSRLIHGRRHPSPSIRRRLIEALNCTEFEELFAMVSHDA